MLGVSAWGGGLRGGGGDAQVTSTGLQVDRLGWGSGNAAMLMLFLLPCGCSPLHQTSRPPNTPPP